MLCEVRVNFTRSSVQNHLTTHGTTIGDYEMRYGAPPGHSVSSTLHCRSLPVPISLQLTENVEVASPELGDNESMLSPQRSSIQMKSHGQVGSHDQQLKSLQPELKLYDDNPVYPVANVMSSNYGPVDIPPQQPGSADPCSSNTTSSIVTSSQTGLVIFRSGRDKEMFFMLPMTIFNYRCPVCQEVTACTSNG